MTWLTASTGGFGLLNEQWAKPHLETFAGWLTGKAYDTVDDLECQEPEE